MKFFTLFLIPCLLIANPYRHTTQRTPTKQIEITDSAYVFEHPGYSDRIKVWWVVVLTNPYEDLFARRPKILVTARDAQGRVLATKDKDFPGIPPGRRIAYGDDLDVDTVPAKIEFTPMPGDFRPASTKASDYFNLEFKQLSITRDWKVVGEMANPFNEEAYFMGTILYRDEQGKLLGGDTFQIHPIPPKSTLPFESYLFKGAVPPQYSKMEYVAFVGFLSDWEQLVANK